MRKILLLNLLLLGYILPMMGQSKKDYAAVLQKCIDLKDLQAYYPKNANGQLKQLYVLQHGVSFTETTKVTKSGKELAFVSKDRLKANSINSYFLFQDFNLISNAAKVAFVYYYNCTPTKENMVVVNLDLQKTGETWAITNSNVTKN